MLGGFFEGIVPTLGACLKTQSVQQTHFFTKMMISMGNFLAAQLKQMCNCPFLGIIFSTKKLFGLQTFQPKISLFKLNHHLDIPVWVPYDGSGTRCQLLPIP